eukprot:scaffold14687_cov19-Tisochrysis_lutea.AAC.2
MLSVDCMLENELCVRFVCRGVPSSPRSGDTGTQLLVRAHDARQLNNLREQMARGHAAAIRNAEADFCELVIHRCIPQEAEAGLCEPLIPCCIPWRSAGAKGAGKNATKKQKLADKAREKKEREEAERLVSQLLGDTPEVLADV